MNNFYRLLVYTSLLVLLSGCPGGGATTPTRYYLIDPVEYTSGQQGAGEDLSIAIMDLQIPQYLERFHIATRTSENRLVFSESHQWGESLRKNLMRTMSRNLSQLLGTIDIGTPLNRSVSKPDFSLQIHIEQFEQVSDGTVKLQARWQILVGEKYQPAGTFSASLQSQESIPQGEYEQMVTVMQGLYADLCKQVADSITAQLSKIVIDKT